MVSGKFLCHTNIKRKGNHIMKVKIIKNQYDDGRIVNYTIRKLDDAILNDAGLYSNLKIENEILRHKISMVNRKVNRNTFWIVFILTAGILAYSYFKEDSKEKDKEIKKIKVKVKGD